MLLLENTGSGLHTTLSAQRVPASTSRKVLHTRRGFYNTPEYLVRRDYAYSLGLGLGGVREKPRNSGNGLPLLYTRRPRLAAVDGGVLISHIAVVAGEGGVPNFMHRRSRMTADPRISTMPGRRTLGLSDQVAIACTKSAVGCSACRTKADPHRSKNHLRGGIGCPCTYFLVYG